MDNVNNVALVYRTVEYCCGKTVDHESSLWSFVAKISALLEDDVVNRVALWGLQGSGKSVIARTLNNNIQKQDAPDVVISRLIFRKLQKFKTCLIILDNVYKSIDLDLLGIPWRNEDINGVRVKILVTTRDRGVCRRLVVDHTLKLDFLSVDEAWKFFCSVVGKTATSKLFEPIAKQVCTILKGYPYAIMVVGKLQQSRPTIYEWKVALSELKRPHPDGIIVPSGMIYDALKLSYDCLQDKMKSCLLLCALYPEGCIIKVKEVVCHMVAKGIIEDCEGIMLVEGLKDVCLLEDGLLDDTVTMHEVIYDFARWLMSTDEGKTYGLSHDS